MNNISYKIRQNIVPFFFAMVLLVGICCAWYFFHPSSPYFKQVSFVVRFEKVGTLSPGNRVAVRGISCGKITKVELTDDAVFVSAEVSVDTRIPKNSNFRLITAGLMGERELNVLSGDSKEYIAENDTVIGFYEEGAAGITRSLREIIASIGEIKKDIDNVDSLVFKPMGVNIESVGGKAKKIGHVLQKKSANWKQSLETILHDCDNTLSRVKTELGNVATKGEETAEKAEKLLPRVDSLLQSTQSLRLFADELVTKVNAKDNSVGLILAEKGVLEKKLDQTAVDIEDLIADIKKDGIKLNIDIF